ncbi:MAG: hypothetical protein MJZ41_01175 [Bacteroidaceae bacterium]|nr:hypothetical protein [Bacteroidaceae bacterium]
MKQEDVDKIIAEALAESKNESKKKWHKGKSSDSIKTARKVLNWIFMIGFVAAIIIYFAMPDQKILFFSVGFGAVVLKLIEFYLRFMF